MDTDFSIIKRLPEYLAGENAELRKITTAEWPRVSKLDADERTLTINNFSLFESSDFGLSSQSRYKNLCDFVTSEETSPITPQRYYWVYSPARGHIVGTLSAYPPPQKAGDDGKTADKNAGRILVVGYNTFPAYQKKGFASVAVGLLSDHVLKHDIASSVCAETDPGNTASAGVLLKAGFRDTGMGLCSSSFVMQEKLVRRFLKTNDPSGRWPIQEAHHT